MKKYFILIFSLVFFVFLHPASSETKKVYTWDEIVSLTLKSNPDLKSAREDIIIANAYSGATRGDLLPSLNATVSAGRTFWSTEENKENAFSYTLSAKQLLFDGLKSYYDYKKSKSDIEAEKYNYFVKESDVLYNVRSSYVNFIKARKYLGIAETIYQRRNDNHNLVKMRYEAGRENRGSLLASDADLSGAKADVDIARRDLALAGKALFSAMGVPYNYPDFEVDGSLEIKVDINTKPDCDQIARQNPLLRQMIAVKKSSLYSKDAAKSAYFPQIYAFLNGDANGDSPNASQRSISAGVQASISIFEGGSTYYSSKVADSEFRQSTYNEEATRFSVIQTLEESWTDLLNKHDEVNVREKQLKAAEERSKIAESQYSIGLISFNNWTIIEEAMVNAMNSYLNARTELLIAEAKWAQAKGEIVRYEKE